MQQTHRGFWPVVIKDKHRVVLKQQLLLILPPANGIFDKFKQYSAGGIFSDCLYYGHACNTGYIRGK